MDFDEVNKELDAVRNNGSDYVKAMNDAEWSRILKQMVDNGDLPEWPEDSVESTLNKTRPIYHDYGVKPPASPVAPQGSSIFVSPWIYHEIQSVLADIDRFERARKTRWARLRKIDKMRREKVTKRFSNNGPCRIYNTYTSSTNIDPYPIYPVRIF